MPDSLPDGGLPDAAAAPAPGSEAAPLTDAETPDDPTAGRPTSPLLVVGLGASAGGIEALERFFRALPDAPGAAFVVVLHLSPDHESHLAEVLQKATAMPVTQVRGNVRTEANTVYVIPPGQSLSMADGALRLSQWADEAERRAPIDLFFRTLGQEHHRCAAVVFSGLGADGSVGITQIREAGGLILAQAPADAAHDAMPRSAIETGLVDDVLPAEGLAARVAAYAAETAAARLPDETQALPETDAEALASVLVSLRLQTGHDFAHYKRATVLRRIGRRMHVRAAPTLAAYADLVREDPEESNALLQDLLISVTNFFRDREAFRTLETDIIPRLFDGKGPGDTVRVWSAGCATGEEAYALAILLAEHAATLERPPECQVFASDIDEDALARAREGRYSEAIVADVSDERLARFFTPEAGHYCVRKELREKMLFASHSLIKDPPFSRVDLVVCRNLLIYLQRDVQTRAFEIFHFALRPDGYLFLGASESADTAAGLFLPVSGPHRVFQRRATAGGRTRALPSMPGRTEPARRSLPAPSGAPPQVGALAGDLHQHLLEAYAPPSAVVDERHDMLHVTETAGRFLHVPGGVPTANVVRAVLPELQLELRLALHRAFQQNKPTVGGPVRARVAGEDVLVLLIVRPVPQAGSDDRLALVLFTEVEDASTGVVVGLARSDGPAGPLVATLEAELARSRERLQATAEEHETSMEELRASNEELQSMNEEYRSATEEIETSREELQSVNEELETVNQELKARMDEVTRVHSDLQHLMASTEIGTLFVDRDLRVQRFTPRVASLFDITASDRGRSLLNLTHRLHDVDLTADAAGVLATLQPAEREVTTHDGETYLVRIRPYRTVDDRIEGVVLTFVDVTERTRAEAALHESEARLRLATGAGGIAVGNWDLTTGRLTGDARLAFLYGLDEAAVTSPEGIDSAALFARVHPDDLPGLEAASAREIEHSTDDYTVEYRAEGADGAWRWLQVRAGVEREAAGRPLRFAGAILDVTARVEAGRALADEARRAAFRIALSDTLRPLADPDAVQKAAARLLGVYLGASRVFYAGVEPDDAHAVVSHDYTDGVASFAGRHLIDGFGRLLRDEFLAGRTLTVSDVSADRRFDAAGKATFAAGEIGASVGVPLVKRGRLVALLGVHQAAPRAWTPAEVALVEETAERTWGAVQRTRAEAAVRASEARYRAIFTSIDEGFALCEIITDAAGEPVSYRFLDANPAFKAMTGLDVVGKTVDEVVPGEAAVWVARFAPVGLGGETVRFEETAVALGQTFSVYASPVEPVGGGQFTQVFSDVTASRQAEAALAAEARRAAFRIALADALRPLADATAIQDETARLLGEYLGASRTFYAEFEPDGVHAVVPPGHVVGVASFAGRHNAEDFGTTLLAAFQAGKTVAAPDEAGADGTTEAERAALAAAEIGAFVGVPLIKGGRLAALLAVHNATPRAWTPAEVTLVEETAERTWAAIARTRAEAAVRESEARARLALDIAAVGSWTWSPADETMTADARTAEICGIPADVPLPVAGLLARVHRADRSHVEAALAAAADPDGDGTYVADLRFVRPDGSVRWTIARGQMRFDAARRAPKSFAGTVLDVTDRETSAAAVRESGERLRLLVEGAQEYAFVGTDIDGRITTWSAGAERIFGWAEAEAVGEMIRMIFPPEDVEANVAEREMTIAAARGKALDERWHVRKSGELFWGSGTMNALRDAAGRLVGYAKILRDNTRRRADEQAIADSEARFRTAVEAATVPVMLYADDGEVLAVSDALVAITGYARADLPTLDAWLALAHGPDAAAGIGPLLTDGFAGGVAGGRVIEPLEMEVRTRRGDVRTWVFSAGGPVALRDGRLFYAGFASDVTEQKRADAALRALNDTLDARVTERTAALAERTEQARALAGALTLAEQRERDRIAQVLHDHVQQLLFGVQFKLQILPPTDPAGVTRVAGEIGALVGDALQATRALTVELSPPVLHGEGLTAALGWLATQMEDTHGLRISVGATGDVTALAEERRLLVFQLVRELLFNVVKHAGVAEARVVVEARPGLLTVHVEDDGRGFGEQTAAANEPGGFGLVSLRQRIDPLGGRIAIVSAPGEGTRVTIELPM